MKIDIKKLKTLREETGVSYALCKKALMEANNDLEKAKQILFKQGAKRIEKKKEKKTSEGRIFSYVHHNGKYASLVELLTQTDFVAKNKEFLELGKNLAMQAASLTFKTKEEFLNQEFIKDASLTVQKLIENYIVKLGENITLSRVIRWELGENLEKSK